MPSATKALEALTQDPELARLESLLQRFNLFEAIGVLKQELSHSKLLATFLDPRQSHGLGTLFLKELLYAILAKENTIAQADIQNWNMNQATVEREWHYVDIFVVDDVNQFVVIVENKISTGEHSDQLNRYFAKARSHYPHHKIFAVYLTPNGYAASDNRYCAVSYTQICHIFEGLIKNYGSTLDADIVMLLEHYTQMLRRHIVSDSDVAVLCREIYRKHRQAIDLILKHTISQPVEIGEYLQLLLEQDDRVSFIKAEKNWIVFVPKSWENIPGPPYIYFEFQFQSRLLMIFCTLSPDGEPAKRKRLFDLAQNYHFTGCPSKLNKAYCRLATISVLGVEDYEKTPEEIEALIVNKWSVFMRNELPRMVQAINDEEWLWELPA